MLTNSLRPNSLTREQNIEIVARAVCKFAGYTPDAPVLYGEGQDVVPGPFGSVVVTGRTSPAWTKYIGLATAVLDALEG